MPNSKTFHNDTFTNPGDVLCFLILIFGIEKSGYAKKAFKHRTKIPWKQYWYTVCLAKDLDISLYTFVHYGVDFFKIPSNVIRETNMMQW